MGGQACVFYGAAEFSRAADIFLLAESANLQRLSEALEALGGECIAVPPFDPEYLARGHAIHFRCHHPEAEGTRIDVMSVLRGMPSFAAVWDRRTTIETDSGDTYELLCLPDLVRAKKTQRDKDWPMVRRLVEAHYFRGREAPNPEKVAFWLSEARTVALLIELAESYSEQLSGLVCSRPLLRTAASADEAGLTAGLEAEEKRVRADDKAYWAPLKAELERLRRQRAGSPSIRPAGLSASP